MWNRKKETFEYNSILDEKTVICKNNNEQYLWMIIENSSKDIFAPIVTTEWYAILLRIILTRRFFIFLERMLQNYFVLLRCILTSARSYIANIVLICQFKNVTSTTLISSFLYDNDHSYLDTLPKNGCGSGYKISWRQ